MPIFSYCMAIVTAITVWLAPVPAAANPVTEISRPVSAPELKLFQLTHKDVIAIAVETRLPAASVPDPLSYTFQPDYRFTTQDRTLTATIAAQPALPGLAAFGTTAIPVASPRLSHITAAATGSNELTLTVSYTAQAAKPQITTVKRKRVIQSDNTIIFRTYLVLTFADAAPSPVKTIVLDPGHGGAALGATSNFLLEKDLNLDIALLTYDLFRRQGYDVYMTRTDDSNPSLLDRADAANILDADIFLSIHNNSMPDDMPDAAKKLYRGTTALYNSAAPRPAKDLAALTADQLASTLRIHQYPLQDRPGLAVLNSTWVPAIIAEVAMMPHPQDAKMLSQRIYRQEAAQALFQAVEKYFANTALAAGRKQP